MRANLSGNRGASECQPWNSATIVLPAPLEQDLDRLCYAVVRYDAMASHGHFLTGVDADDTERTFTVDALLNAVHDFAVHDMAAQAALAEAELGALRRRCRPEDVLTHIRFSGSDDVGVAEVDLLVTARSWRSKRR